PATHQRGAPAERTGQVGQRLRHRRAADDDQARRGLHRLDEHLQRALALAGDRHDRHPLRDRLAELIRRAQEQQARLAVGDHLPGLADDHRLRAGPADPALDLAVGRDDRAAAQLARRRALPPHDGGHRERPPLAGQPAGPLQDTPAVHSPIASLAGASLASEGWSSALGHRWRGVRPGACGLTGTVAWRVPQSSERMGGAPETSWRLVIASQTRSGSSGMSMLRTPVSAIASITALTNAAGPPTAAHSPTPLAPI